MSAIVVILLFKKITEFHTLKLSRILAETADTNYVSKCLNVVFPNEKCFTFFNELFYKYSKYWHNLYFFVN